jgi:4-amino-4-deoxy-L-arabinose transferase-like glycosyltransferase
MRLNPSFQPLWSSIARHRRFYLFFAVVAIGLRLLFILKFALIAPDSLVYGDIAKNWLHGVYGLSGGRTPGPGGTPSILGIEPTYIRMPGYPAFLALCFVLFGSEHYHAVMFVNLIIDVITCFVIADLALRTAGERAARIAFALSATCVMFANYVATPLTEPLAIFAAAVALNCAARALDDSPRKRWWIWCSMGVGFGILLRPDGGILLGALLVYLVWLLLSGKIDLGRALAAAAILTAVSLAPLLPWTIRNWRTMHRFQPLAPVYANSPGEFVPLGFIRWQKSWIVDYSSVEDVWFHVPGDELSIDSLPSRAFDNDAQRSQTEQLFAEYDQTKIMSPALDKKFAALAEERIRGHSLRFYVWLPLLRALDLWVRPHTEMLPLDSHWWQFDQDVHDSILGTAVGLLGWFYVAAALLALRPGVAVRYAGLFVTFFVLRSAFLAYMPNPEQRYMLECFPALLVFAGAGLARIRRSRHATIGQPA